MAYQHLWRRLMAGNNTDADFRAWGSGVSAAIQALGWVQTADTGQIDWLTVLKPTGYAQKMGCEVYRPTDALQASAPWFVRFDYGSSPNAPSRPGLFVRFGSGTDGAGTLTGASNQITLDLNIQQVTAPRPWLFVGDGAQGILGCIAGVLDSDAPWVFVMERTQAKGVPNGQGAVLLATTGYTGAPRVGVMAQRWGEAAATISTAPCLTSTAAGPRMAGHYDTGSIVHPLYYNLGTGFLAGPIHSAFVVDPAAAPEGVTIEVLHDGATRKFFVSPRPYIYPGGQVDTAVNYRLAVRWE